MNIYLILLLEILNYLNILEDLKFHIIDKYGQITYYNVLKVVPNFTALQDSRLIIRNILELLRFFKVRYILSGDDSGLVEIFCLKTLPKALKNTLKCDRIIIKNRVIQLQI